MRLAAALALAGGACALVPSAPGVGRRQLMSAAAAAAVAAPPLAARAADEGMSPAQAAARAWELSRRPRPPMALRPRLDLKFAVQLARTSYAVADDMGFVAMDDFQRTFFLNRQAEWQDYRDSLPFGNGVTQVRAVVAVVVDPAYLSLSPRATSPTQRTSTSSRSPSMPRWRRRCDAGS